MPLPPFEPYTEATLRKVFAPFTALGSPVADGLDDIPAHSGALLIGNHTIYGMLDVPNLGLSVLAGTGRHVRALGDHAHFNVPGWSDVLTKIGAVRGTRENCGELLDGGDLVVVFPGGGREVNRRKGERYKLIWKERIGFARMAIAHQVPIVPFASVGVDDMFEVTADIGDLLDSPLGSLLGHLGVTEQKWFRDGDAIPSISRGTGLAGTVRPEQQYFRFAEPIDTTRFVAALGDAEAETAAARTVRDEVEAAVKNSVKELKAVQASDPDRYLGPRLIRAAKRTMTGRGSANS